MKNRIQRAANKALALVLFAAIIGLGIEAVMLTHVHASITVTFGEQQESVPALKVSQLDAGMQEFIKGTHHAR